MVEERLLGLGGVSKWERRYSLFHLRQLLIPDFLTPKAKIHSGQFLKEASKSAYCTGLKLKKKIRLAASVLYSGSCFQCWCCSFGAVTLTFDLLCSLLWKW